MLYDHEQEPVLENPLSGEVNFSEKEVVDLSFETDVMNPLKWRAEDPNLYTFVLRLVDENGEDIEAVSCRVGFRTFELKDGLMKINGERIVSKGVNGHEFAADKRRAVGGG